MVCVPIACARALLQMDRVLLRVVLHQPLRIHTAESREHTRDDGGDDADGGRLRAFSVLARGRANLRGGGAASEQDDREPLQIGELLVQHDAE